MPRLPVPGSDDNQWGDILNEFLDQAHNSDGTLKDVGILADKYTLPAGGIPQSDLDSSLVTTIEGKADKSTLTAKGDLYAATSSSSPARVGVGSNGQFLQADSSAATGVSWSGVDDPAAALLDLGIVSVPLHSVTSDHALNSGVLVFVRTRCTKPQQITRLGVWLQAGGGTPTGSNSLAIYDGSGNLIEETVDMSAILNSAGYREGDLNNPVQLSIGNYYLGVLTHYSSAPGIRNATGVLNYPVVAGVYMSVYLTGQVSFPASFTPSSATLNNSMYFIGGR